MAQLVVGVGEYKISGNEGDTIKTFALGSCVAVIIYDSVEKIAGMLHVALPESSIMTNNEKPPGHFADKGVPLFIREIASKGANRKNSWIKLVGGANVSDPNFVFDIGKRNVLAIKKILWKEKLGPIAEDVGGNHSRTVTIDVSTGDITITNKDRKWQI